MQVEKELARVRPEKETLLTIGVFDGVHLGHKHLLTYLKNKAGTSNRLSGVVTFKSHPRAVLSAENRIPWLTDLDTRISLLQDFGVDMVIALSFTHELAQLSAQEFVKLLVKYIKMRGLVVGPDFALGRDREGNIEKLRLLGQEMGFSVDVVPAVIINGEVVSSSSIRQALARGDMKKVKEMFGRYFSLSGRVVSGDGRGRTLGFPTANIDVNPEQALPSDGVYATIAHVGQKLFPSVTNVGFRPTFSGDKRLVETYLIGFKGELLGQRLTIDLVDRLREEKRFGSVDELKSQISGDVGQARRILAKLMKQGST